MTTATAQHSAGDPIPAKCAVIRVHVTELRQLFNSIDPSPFRSRDLDPKAEEFIVGWAKDFGRTQQLALVVSIDRPAGAPEEEVAVLREAVREFFRQRALGQRQRLRELLRVGRISLAIGLVVLASAVAVGNFLASLMKGDEVGQILREVLFIGGWVSMWRPLEIFLYDWWPIREEAQLSDRLAAMPVRNRVWERRRSRNTGKQIGGLRGPWRSQDRAPLLMVEKELFLRVVGENARDEP